MALMRIGGQQRLLSECMILPGTHPYLIIFLKTQSLVPVWEKSPPLPPAAVPALLGPFPQGCEQESRASPTAAPSEELQAGLSCFPPAAWASIPQGIVVGKGRPFGSSSWKTAPGPGSVLLAVCLWAQCSACLGLSLSSVT